MSGLLFPPPFVTALDDNGAPISGATLSFFLTGTSTPATVYADAGLSGPLPVPVVADVAGRFPAIYLPATVLRAVLKDADNVAVRDIDPINTNLEATLAASSGAAEIGFIQGGSGAVARTVQAKLRENVSITDFGAQPAADPTATTAAIAAAIAAVSSLGGGVLTFPPGDFRINGTLTIPSRVKLLGQGAGRIEQPAAPAATTISWYGGATEMIRVGYQASTIVNGGIDGIRLDGRALATRGLAIKDAQHLVFTDLVMTGATVAALYLTNTPGLDPTGFSVFRQIQISLRGGATDAAHGILIDGVGAGVDGVTLCSWDDIRIEHANGDGVRVNERGDGMTWYDLYTFRAGSETGFGVRSTASASGVVSAWSFYNALPNGGVQIDTPNTAKGWVFDSIQDIDVDPSAIDIIFGNGASDVSVLTTASTRQFGPAKIRGFRNAVIEDAMQFRRWDSANNVLMTARANYLSGGTYAGANIVSAAQPGGAVEILCGNASGNALYISSAGSAAAGYALTYRPQMAVTWTPITLTNCVHRAGFVATFDDLPANGIYVEAAPATSGFYRCVTRSGGVETATVTPVGIAAAVVQWRIEYGSGIARFFYRTFGNNQWALAAIHTINIPSVSLADVIYVRTLENANKALHAFDYKIAWELEH